MNRQYVFLCVFILTLSVSSINAFRENNWNSSYDDNVNEFCQHFFESIANNLDGNFVSSPINALIPLLMTAYGAAGETRQQLAQKLRLPIDESFTSKYYQKFIKNFLETPNVELYIANRIFVGNEIEITPYFRRISRKLLHSEIKTVNFENTTISSSDINTWCGRQTDYKITDIVNARMIEGAQFLMISIAYFQGDWQMPFKHGLHNRTFYLSANDSISLPMMCSFNMKYNYGLTLSGSAIYIELPYKVTNNKKRLSMYILLPFQHHKLNSIIKNIHKINFKQLEWPTSRINLCMPEFYIKNELNLKNVFYNMGIHEIFKTNADFSMISEASLMISSIIQKISIAVNAEGSKVDTIYTEAGMQTRTIRFDMNIDRPFIAAIISKATGTPLYWARINDPRNE